ncbi:MAG: MarR family transcriptional regulator [Gemmatimonadota bacterium]|nr:MAG: MarR family transcriptional regulator [Gemmatimonadota bacterium]
MITSRVQVIRDVLGSAHIFASAVNDLMQDRLHAVVGEQLTFAQLKLLKLVARKESYHITEVAAFMGVSNAAASKAVDRLVRRGLLSRSEAEEDRRAVVVALTQQGRRLLDEYEQITTRTLEDVFGDVPAEGLQQTADLLDELSLRLVEQDNRSENMCFRCSIYFREKCLLRSRGPRSCHFYTHKSKKDE